MFHHSSLCRWHYLSARVDTYKSYHLRKSGFTFLYTFSVYSCLEYTGNFSNEMLYLTRDILNARTI